MAKKPWYWTDKCIAYLTSMNDWIGLLRILQPQIEMKTDQSDFEPKITIKCKDFPNPAKDLELIRRYVIPGTYWTEQ